MEIFMWIKLLWQLPPIAIAEAFERKAASACEKEEAYNSTFANRSLVCSKELSALSSKLT
jgi:hypothetical protein